MMDWVQSLPVYGSGMLIIGGFVALTVIIGTVVSRIFPQQIRLEHNDLAGFILAVIGVVYAVLLAFVAVTVWERFEAAETRTYEEASSLSLVYRDADDFSKSQEIRSALRSYAKLVAEDEWPAMAHGAQSPAADALIEQLDRTVRQLDVRSMRQEDVHQQMLVAMDQALRDRDVRLTMSSTGISSVMWLVLMLGAVVTVAFTYLFGYKHGPMRGAMAGSLGLLIGLVLFLTVSLDYPFKGGITIGPEAFEDLHATFRSIGP
jgi:putative Mn2+ efflux pump MntP